jgi:hypothetical protein
MILDIIYGDEGEGNGISTTNKTDKRLRIPCVTDKVYEITLYLMFNREFMNDVYRTFRIISRGL